MDQGEKETWDTVGGATQRSHSPAPTTEVTVPEVAQQATGANLSGVSRRKEARPLLDYWS
jgi:hypothetical protein